ncbi:MAG: hypothetical protein AAFP70_19200, partial [Calditrichota bacterium]
MKRIAKINILLLLLFCAQTAFSQHAKKELPHAKAGPQTSPVSNYSIFNINNMSLRLFANGHINQSLSDRDAIVYPRGKTGAVYSAGFLWGGRVLDGDPSKPPIRVGGQTYAASTIPGPIVQSGPNPVPGTTDFPVYRIRRDWQSLTGSSLEILRDAADIFEVELSEVTPQQAQQILDQYASDWANWPVYLGAPYEDLNGNGSYERGIDRPGIAEADQVLWTVCNDLDTSLTLPYYGAPPIGLEMQVTIWGYARPNSALNEMLFQRYRLINKSGFPIDSMFIGQWADGDLGRFTDDFIGVDSTRDMIYIYNGRSTDAEATTFGIDPPAFGYSLLQGPVVIAPNDTAVINFDRISGYKNKRMTSSSYFAFSSVPFTPPPFGDYKRT